MLVRGFKNFSLKHKNTGKKLNTIQDSWRRLTDISSIELPKLSSKPINGGGLIRSGGGGKFQKNKHMRGGAFIRHLRVSHHSQADKNNTTVSVVGG